MKKNQGRITAHSMVAFLLFEPSFPRSLRYCLRSADGLLRRIWPSEGMGSTLPPSRARVAALLQWLDAQALSLDMAQIHKLLTHVVDETTAICAHVSEEIQGPPLAMTQQQEPGEIAG